MHKDLTYVMEWFDTYRELYVPKEEDKDTENAWGADNDVLHLLEESERSKIKLGQEELDGLCRYQTTPSHRSNPYAWSRLGHVVR